MSAGPRLIGEARGRVRGRCNTPLGEPCTCFRPRMHIGPCACTCALYGSVHGAVAVPAAIAGALVTDQPWRYNGPLKREALEGQR